MNRIYERVLHKSGSSNKKRRQKNDSSEENCVPKRRRKGKSKPTLQPVGEIARREEERLEKLVLGDVTDLLFDDSEVPAFSSCTSAMEDSGVEEGDSDSSPQMSDTLASPEREPAWQDEEDLNICVSEAMNAQGRKVPEILSGGSNSDPYTRILKHKYETRMGTPSWANLGHRSAKKSGSSDDDDSDDELLQHCGNFLSNRSSVLRKGTIEVKRVCDLNHDTYTEGPVIKAVEFHPSSSVALVAGLSGIASLFDVNGKKNTKLHSVQFERYPILCAHFVPSGEQFVIGSRHHGFFYNYDMMVCRSTRAVPNSGLGITNTKNFKLSPDGRLIAVCGRFGNIHLLTANTLEGVGLLKMNSDVSAIAFDNDGSRLFSHGEGGEVHVWDIGTRRCLGRFIDDGCIWGSSLAVAPEGRFLACGARSGVVNVYETAGLLSAANRAPRPTKILLNLTTPATTVKFNASSELLGMASDDKENAFRLVHFPSMTVFSNFPGSSQPHLSRPQCLDFSPNSGYLAIGNNKGAALLYRLKHYGNY